MLKNENANITQSVDVHEKALSAFKTAGNLFTLMNGKEPANINYLNQENNWKFVKLSGWTHAERMSGKSPLVDYQTAINKLIEVKQAQLDASEQSHIIPGDYRLGLMAEQGYLFLDLDHVDDEIYSYRELGTGLIKQISDLTKNTYCEISQSGSGVHFLFMGIKTIKCDRDNRAKVPFEFYDQDHFATLTGNVIDQKHTQVQVLDQAEIIKLEKFLLGQQHYDEITKPKKEDTQKVPASSSDASFGNDLTVKEVEDLACEKDKEFDDLFHAVGVTENNRSEMDWALAKKLIFWTNHDVEKANAIFKDSELYALPGRSDKWEEPGHAKDGRTYGQLTLDNANKTVSASKGFKYKKSSKSGNLDHLLKAVKKAKKAHKLHYKSMDDLFGALKIAGQQWHKDHDKKLKGGEVKPAEMKGRDVLDILETLQLWGIPYNNYTDNILYVPIHFYDWSDGIWKGNTQIINQMIQAINPSITSDRVRENLRNTIKADRIAKPMQLSKSANHDLIAVQNGVFDQATKKLHPFDPYKYVFTQKIATRYVDNPQLSPLGTIKWTPEKWFKEVAGESENKLTLIWQTILACIQGNCWIKKMVLLLDDDLGNTGKSTFLKLIRSLIGQANYAAYDVSQLDNPNILYSIIGKQCVLGDEFDSSNPRNFVKNSTFFKNIVGNGPVRVKQLYTDSYATELNVFLLQTGNSFPRFGDNGSPVFNRIRVIKFTKQYENNPENTKVIKDYVIDPRVLEWVLHYALNNVKIDGTLIDTKESQDEIKQEKTSSNSFDAFCDEVLDHLRYLYLPLQTVYNLYYNYCVSSNFSKAEILGKQFFKHKIEKMPNSFNWEYSRGRIKKTYLATHIFLSISEAALFDAQNGYGFVTRDDLFDKEQDFFPKVVKIWEKAAGTRANTTEEGSAYALSSAKKIEDNEQHKAFYGQSTTNGNVDFTDSHWIYFRTSWLTNRQMRSKIDDYFARYDRFFELAVKLNYFFGYSHKYAVINKQGIGHVIMVLRKLCKNNNFDTLTDQQRLDLKENYGDILKLFNIDL